MCTLLNFTDVLTDRALWTRVAQISTIAPSFVLKKLGFCPNLQNQILFGVKKGALSNQAFVTQC